MTVRLAGMDDKDPAQAADKKAAEDRLTSSQQRVRELTAEIAALQIPQSIPDDEIQLTLQTADRLIGELYQLRDSTDPQTPQYCQIDINLGHLENNTKEVRFILRPETQRTVKNQDRLRILKVKIDSFAEDFYKRKQQEAERKLKTPAKKIKATLKPPVQPVKPLEVQQDEPMDEVPPLGNELEVGAFEQVDMDTSETPTTPQDGQPKPAARLTRPTTLLGLSHKEPIADDKGPRRRLFSPPPVRTKEQLLEILKKTPADETQPGQSQKPTSVTKSVFTSGVHKKLVRQAKNYDLERILNEAHLTEGLRLGKLSTDEQQALGQRIYALIQDRDKALRRLMFVRCGRQALRQLPLDAAIIKPAQLLRHPRINPAAYTLEMPPQPGQQVTEKIRCIMSDSSDESDHNYRKGAQIEDDPTYDDDLTWQETLLMDAQTSSRSSYGSRPAESTPRRSRSPVKQISPNRAASQPATMPSQPPKEQPRRFTPRNTPTKPKQTPEEMDTTSPKEVGPESQNESTSEPAKLVIDESRTDEPATAPGKRSKKKQQPADDFSREYHDDPALKHVQDLTRSEQDASVDTAFPEDKELWNSLKSRRANLVGNTDAVRKEHERLTQRMAEVMKRMGERFRAEKVRLAAQQQAATTRPKLFAPDPKSTSTTTRQLVVKMKNPQPVREPSVQIQDELLDSKVINSANSAKLSRREKKKAKKEARKEAEKEVTKQPPKEPTKPRSDLSIKTPKPNPAKRHKSSEDLDTSDAGPQKPDKKGNAKEEFDYDAAKQRMRELIARAGTAVTKTEAERPHERSKPTPKPPLKQPKPATSKKDSDDESEKPSEPDDEISDHGEADPYEGFKGDRNEEWSHEEDTDASEWPAPDDQRRDFKLRISYINLQSSPEGTETVVEEYSESDEQPSGEAADMLNIARASGMSSQKRLPTNRPRAPFEPVTYVNTASAPARASATKLGRTTTGRFAVKDTQSLPPTSPMETSPAPEGKTPRKGQPKPAKSTKKLAQTKEKTPSEEEDEDEEEEDEDDDDTYQTPEGSEDDDNDDDDQPPPASAPQQQGEPEISDNQNEPPANDGNEADEPMDEDSGDVYVPQNYRQQVRLTPDSDPNQLLQEWNEDTQEVLPLQIPNLPKVNVKHPTVAIKRAHTLPPRVSEYDPGWMYTFAALKALATCGPKFATPKIAFQLLRHHKIGDIGGGWRQLSQSNVYRYCNLGYNESKIIRTYTSSKRMYYEFPPEKRDPAPTTYEGWVHAIEACMEMSWHPEGLTRGEVLHQLVARFEFEWEAKKPQLVDPKYKPVNRTKGGEKYMLGDDLDFVLSKGFFQKRFGINQTREGERYEALKPSTLRQPDSGVRTSEDSASMARNTALRCVQDHACQGTHG
ncbi:titin homolog [Paramacrobiotus metropolitanus]|uniref:titin homolog n=1 Tax=Paramacrobiotus metropolitanus TaxID=2943436 RepID=UPI002445C035|nr:titin homolog [Paramacrobiotus metropolitanus]